MVIKDMYQMRLLVLLVLLLSFQASFAETKTGLSSSLIKEWKSSVDRSKCPDFRYPSYPPSIARGATVYKTNCASCHGEVPKAASPEALAKLRSQTPEKQFEYVCGGDPSGVHKFGKTLTLEARWDSLQYFLANSLGYYAVNSPELASMDALFGGNCAVCHGTRGQGDGNLHKKLYPPPANFTMMKRLFTRSDEKLFNEISYGIPWTGMPAWKNRHDFDKHVDFDEETVWKLVRYVRQFSFVQDIDRLDYGRQKLENYKKSVGLKTGAKN